MSNAEWRRYGTIFLGLWLVCLIGELVTGRRPRLELVKEYVSDNGRVDLEHAGQEVHS